MNIVHSVLRTLNRVGLAVVLVLISLTISLTACGENKPSAPLSTAYTFSATTPEIVADSDTVVDIRLVHKATGKPVADAVIFETRFDMEPDGMGGMDAQATSMGSPSPGVYRFKLSPTMAGRWALKLSAKVQGEAETVRGVVVITAR